MRQPTDSEILNWLEKHPGYVVPCSRHDGRRKLHWRRVFGPKDATNHFPSLRAVVTAQIASK